MKNKNNIKFNVLDWNFYHEASDEDEDEYTIRLFGRTSDDKTIYVRVDKYTPYFYVEIPSYWKKYQITVFVNELKDKMEHQYKSSIVAFDVVEKNKFWGFTDEKIFTFVRLIFRNIDAMRAYENLLRKKLQIKSISYKPYKYKVYESNIEPLIRCMHIQNLNACGWIEIAGDKYEDLGPETHCDININTNWINLKRVEDTSIAPFVVASYDIECTSEDGSFPQATRDGDKIIQIGTTFNRYGEDKCFFKHLITLGSCAPIPGIEIESYETEEEVLLAWKKMMDKMNPDIITGFNIFGFDEKYLYFRSKKLGCNKQFSFLSRVKEDITEFKTKKLSSSALGDNMLYYYNSIGRVKIDLMKVVQRDYKLTSYKLDNVASEFIKEKIDKVSLIRTKSGKEKLKFYTKSIKGLQEDSYISVVIDDGLAPSKYDEEKKFKILKKSDGWVKVVGDEEDYFGISEYFENPKFKVYWCQAKDDIGPKDIFRLQKGSAEDRAIIGKYCIKDCELVNILMAKLEIITNNVGMANVCNVPLSYIFIRGQGVKIFSLIAKKCRIKNYVMPVIRKPWKSNEEEEEENKNKVPEYEGAFVFVPKAGVYFEPITVLDYASLYPRSMIERNLSHETILFNGKYKNRPNYKFHDTYYNNTKCDKSHCTKIHCVNIDCKCQHEEYVCNIPGCTKLHCRTHCEFAQKLDDDGTPLCGIIPEILNDLLDARSDTKKLMKNAKEAFKKNIYNGLQLAYKITANSLYGQTGAVTSPVALKHIAASTTAIGKELLKFAQDNVEEKFPGSEVIYGDTDSIFVKFKILDENGKPDTSHKSLVKSIELGKQASDYANSLLPYPHNLEYEKVYWPFCIISKKRYVGNLYGEDPNSFYQNSMGIVLKRRDNANIVKVIVGGIVDIIINEQDIDKAVRFTQKSVKKLLTGKYPMDKFIITKTLRAEYKKPEQIPHKVLADRMAERDPGNKPQTNDRIPFAYIEIEEKKGQSILQGDRIEHPKYIINNGLKLDYLFYLTNQIMKPALQFFDLVLDKPEEIFLNYIYKEQNRRKGMKEITHFFKPKNKKNKLDMDLDNEVNYMSNENMSDDEPLTLFDMNEDYSDDENVPENIFDDDLGKKKKKKVSKPKIKKNSKLMSSGFTYNEEHDMFSALTKNAKEKNKEKPKEVPKKKLKKKKNIEIIKKKSLNIDLEI